MKKHAFTLFVAVGGIFILKAVHNNDLLNKGHNKVSLLTQFQFDLTTFYKPELITQGLHPINQYGWYIMTEQIDHKIKLEKPKYDQEDYREKHGLYNLILVHLSSSTSDVPKKGLTRLKMLATSRNLEQYPWVFSLSKLSPENTSCLREKSSLLGVVSQITYQGSLLALEKGRSEDFYEQSRILCPKLVDKSKKNYLNKVYKYSEPNYESIFIQKFYKNQIKKSKKISDNIHKYLAQLKLEKDAKKLYEFHCNLNDREKIDYYYNHLDQLKADGVLEQSLDGSNEKECKENLAYQFLKSDIYSKNHKKLEFLVNDLKDRSKANKAWKQYQKILVEELGKPKVNMSDFSQTQVKNFWIFDTKICPGVVDVCGIGEGVYTYPQFHSLSFDCLSNSLNYLMYYRLAGITVQGGIEGETNFALNLTTQEIKKWMLKVMDKYYKNQMKEVKFHEKSDNQTNRAGIVQAD